MSREGEFLIYCIEIYKAAKSMNGRDTMRLFNRYHVTEYVKRYFGALHTTGEKYIIEDIDSFIAAAKNVT